MRTPQSAVADFVGRRRPGATGDAAAPAVPRVLALPLAERDALLRKGELSAAELYGAAASWEPVADQRYRACAQLRVTTGESVDGAGGGHDGDEADGSGRGGGALRVGVKDTVDVRGFATRLGLRHYRHHPRESATVVAGLRRAEVNAKVITTELNIGVGSGCGNPYFPQFDPAGSSTGSAVAVAANICDVALGTDVLGSVRWPAGRCGVVGLRTTHDPAKLAGIFPLSPCMDAPGWVARTADDLAFAWRHLGLGEAPRLSAPSLRVGVPQELYRPGVIDPEIAGALDTASAALTSRGHRVASRPLGELWNCRAAAWELCAREAWDGHQVWRDRLVDELMPSTWRALETGAKVTDERLAEIRGSMAQLRAGVVELFAAESVDVWLMPLDPGVPRPRGMVVAASTIPDADDPAFEREVGFTPVASFAGLPAVTVPVGRDPEHGAPLAVQLVGRPGDDGSLIRLAQQLTTALEPLELRPA
ncbi:amidase [Streptomyces bathyalis]|uniref:Amidase n=1 Tax=Streptomyces bathyalis TaxID=2710756 RepID=A0A7T1T6M1_9ACTN|nr:amidase [Streptomyces bathyalis]QPP07351.1 amidase [Streptomyces bathyalis]